MREIVRILLPSQARLSVVIVGGGIGGLCAAVALVSKGVAVTVCERASEFGEVGAGIQLSPNATRILHAWGFGPALQSVAFRPDAVEARGWLNGDLIGHAPLDNNIQSSLGSPYLHIHRADLLALLIDYLRNSRLAQLRLASPISHCCPNGESWVALHTGEKISGDVLVGADGIHSIIRATLFGNETPRFTGSIAWRGIVPARSIIGNDVRAVTSLWMGPGAHFVHYYIRRGELLNFVGVVEANDLGDESWSTRGTKKELAGHFRNWHPTIQKIIASAPENGCYRWALFDREPLPEWCRWKTTLLGDACHPTLPSMAQGACMAIEDAAVLGECLDGIEKDGISAAFKRFEALRKPRTTAIQLRSRRYNKLYHMRPPLSWARNFIMRAGAGLSGHMEQIYAYDAFASAID